MLVVLVLSAVIFLIQPEAVWPPSIPAALLVLWIVSFIAGRFFSFLRIPPLLGILVSGIVLRNTAAASVVEPILSPQCGSTIRCVGLANILMIAGLEIDTSALRRMGSACLRLTVLPGVSEAFAMAFMGHWVFGMPISLSLTMGFIIGAVSPAVVVTGMFDLQKRGYGIKHGIPSLVVAAASLDDVVALSGFSMAGGAAFSENKHWYQGALNGPINMVLGFAAGVMAFGLVFLSHKCPQFKKEGPLLLLSTGLLLLYLLRSISYECAGFLGCITMCSAARSFGESDRALKLALICWNRFSEPLLFGLIGFAFDFKAIPPNTIPRSCLVVVLCVCFVRVPMAYFAVCGTEMTFREKFFVALVWMPKATVQAALGSLPLEMALRSNMSENYTRWGGEILTTSVISILITAPIGLLAIQFLGPVWLRQDEIRFPELGGDRGDVVGKRRYTSTEFNPDDEFTEDSVLTVEIQEEVGCTPDPEPSELQPHAISP